jgi:Methyltransferase domain
MGLLRSVEPELLDQMAADDPRVVRARRDLKRLNAVILQTGIMVRLLAQHWGDGRPRTILDLGAGDGTFMLSVARRLAARWPGVTATLLDRQNIVSQKTREAFGALGWKVETVAADVFAYLEQIKNSGVDTITTNLFLHHFEPEALARLLALALLWVIGCNEVSLHDAIVSVRAGFSGEELSALWPSRDRFDLNERAARLFTHCFVARRR